MPDTGESTTRSRPALLVGSGRRPGELGAVLAALGAVRAQTQESRGTGASIEPHRPSGLSDLEELLAQRPREGILILDYERVPGEDIGFVRRFLERHAEWRLIVVGEDGRDRRARGLLGLPRAQWLPWPPDLDQIASLLPAEDSSRLPAEELEDPEARGNSRPAARVADPAPSPADTEPLDLGALVEEILAGESLGDDAPRYVFHCDGKVLLKRDGAAFAAALEGLLSLARFGAGADGVVDVTVESAPGSGGKVPHAVRIRIEFPASAIPKETWGALLDKPLKLPRELGLVVRAARGAAGELRAQGARVSLAPLQGNRLRIELLHVAEGSQQGTEAAPAGDPARRAKAEDPFA